ncbi:MAG: hypothetical protein BWY68_00748 [bacterium ADurb.Bin400]|nr:MAG: hypothetical protein BWY68_00748 [bacterium ADurb.Bin400]
MPIVCNKLIRALLIFTLLLIVTNIVLWTVYFHTNLPADRVLKLIDLDGENNIPAAFSTVLLMASALLLLVIYQQHRLRYNNSFRYWLMLSAIFFYLAHDELFQFHEAVMDKMREIWNFQGILYFSWVIPGSIFVLLVSLYFIKFLRQLPDDTRHHFIASTATYIGGALGMELINGIYVTRYGGQDLTYHLLTITEESLEIFGAILFISALLHYLKSHLSFNPDPQIMHAIIKLRTLGRVNKAFRNN